MQANQKQRLQKLTCNLESESANREAYIALMEVYKGHYREVQEALSKSLTGVQRKLYYTTTNFKNNTGSVAFSSLKNSIGGGGDTNIRHPFKAMASGQ